MELEARTTPDKLGQFHTSYCVAVPQDGVSGPLFKTNSILLYRRNEHEKTFCMTLALLFHTGVVRLRKDGCPRPCGFRKPSSNTPVVAVPPLTDSRTVPFPRWSSCTFDPALFGGKLQSCAYAGNGTLLCWRTSCTSTTPGLPRCWPPQKPLRDF